jgi:hypothetical protein
MAPVAAIGHAVWWHMASSAGTDADGRPSSTEDDGSCRGPAREAPGNGAAPEADAFRAAAVRPAPHLAAELWQFLRTEKRWFLVPIVLVLSLLGALLALGGTGAAPFIYTLF